MKKFMIRKLFLLNSIAMNLVHYLYTCTMYTVHLTASNEKYSKSKLSNVPKHELPEYTVVAINTNMMKASIHIRLSMYNSNQSS